MRKQLKHFLFVALALFAIATPAYVATSGWSQLPAWTQFPNNCQGYGCIGINCVIVETKPWQFHCQSNWVRCAMCWQYDYICECSIAIRTTGRHAELYLVGNATCHGTPPLCVFSAEPVLPELAQQN